MCSCPESAPAQPHAGTSLPSLRIFVYGTLMRCGEFHDAYCSGATSIEKAYVLGCVDRSGCYPILTVPEADVLALGTADLWKDLDGQDRPAALLGYPDVLSAPWAPAETSQGVEPHGEWERIAGELITLDNARERLSALDQLEGFEPKRHWLYVRSLIPVYTKSVDKCTLAWAWTSSRLLKNSSFCWPSWNRFA